MFCPHLSVSQADSSVHDGEGKSEILTIGCKGVVMGSTVSAVVGLVVGVLWLDAPPMGTGTTSLVAGKAGR